MLTLQMPSRQQILSVSFASGGDGSFCHGFGLQRFLPRLVEGDPCRDDLEQHCVHLPLQHSLTKPALCTGGAMKILGNETQEGERRTRVCDTPHPNPRILC